MKQLDCDLHDYFEIACTFGYELEVVMLDGEKVTGKAKDLGYDQDRNETLILIENDAKHEVPLIKVQTIKSLTAQSQFKEVQIN